MKISAMESFPVLDSNGRGAVEIRLKFEGCDALGRAIAPRGSTTGDYEASFFEDHRHFGLEAAKPAIVSARSLLQPALTGRDFHSVAEFDAALREIDPSPQFSLLGGNVAIAASLAFAKGFAKAQRVPLHRVLSDGDPAALPLPMFNIIDGASVLGSGIGGIEFLLIPEIDDVTRAIQMGIQVRNAVRNLLGRQGIVAGDSPQGALLLASADCEYPLALILEAAAQAGYTVDTDFTLGLDLAASDYFGDDGRYTYPWPVFETGHDMSPEDNLKILCAEYSRLISTFHVSFIEDGFAELDLRGWRSFAHRRARARMIADDLCASNASRIADACEDGLIQGVLVKPNQTGTLTSAMQALAVANTHGLLSVVSQRSGENDDDSITHLAVAGGARYLKFGGPARMDRIIKLNALLKFAREAAIHA
ncbi:Enolase (plasmid) [Burkholderia sp. AD24]|nr:Enolase [Burkholderia sp. AD24]